MMSLAMIGIDMDFMINLPYLSQERTPRKRVFEESFLEKEV